MAPRKKIAVMTSGGDSQGMAAVIRAVVRTGINMNCDVFCVQQGYNGLIEGGEYIRKTEWADVRGYLPRGGTPIRTARCKAFYERPGRLTAAKNMVINGIDAIIICGGDGSLTGADRFRAEWPSLLEELVSKGELTAQQIVPHKHLNIVGLVGSIDNDLSGTDATIGCYSALDRISTVISWVQDTADSHSRAFVIEVMGRHCGWLALMAGVASGADFIFIPEQPREDNWKEEMCSIVKKHRDEGKHQTIVVMAEGAQDRYGKKITTDMVKDLLSDPHGLDLDTRVTIVGHPQRGGKPVAHDRMLATLQGVEAVHAVLEATPETETCFIAINENKIVRKPLMAAVQATKEVAEVIKAQDFEKAVKLRDTEFADMYNSFMITSNMNTGEDMTLSAEKRMKIGFITIGAPAGGVNAALRAAVAYCLSRGHEPVAIHNGFAGFARHHADEDSSVRPFDWLEVDTWATWGGSEIGTNRELPEESGMELIANLIAKYKFDAIFLIGGFEAFHSVLQLEKARDKYPSLCIPITLLPATISNNVPGSEYSLGSDTSLNELIAFADKLKLSASASRRRVFVCETQGGRSGWLAMIGGLTSGATAVYTPEEGLSMDMIVADIRHLRDVFQQDKGKARAGRLILINETASKVHTAKAIADYIHDEGHGRFQARESNPGHTQQGDIPSPIDRCRAVRLAIKCVKHLEQFGPKAQHDIQKIKKDPLTASVIGIQGAAVVFSAITDLEIQTDWKNRRPKSAHWMYMKDIVDMLGGRPSYPVPEKSLVGIMAKDAKRGLIVE